VNEPPLERGPSPPDPARLARARSDRLVRLRASLTSAGFEASIVSTRQYLRFVTGQVAAAGPGFLLVTESKAWLVGPEDGSDPEAVAALGIEPVPYPAYASDRLLDPTEEACARLARLLEALPPGARLGVEGTNLPLAALAGRTRTSDAGDLTGVLRDLRRPRDEVELEATERAVYVVERCLAAAAAVARPGASERDLDTAMRGALFAAVGDDARPDWLVGSGPRAALSDPRPSDRRLKAGEPVLLDIFPEVEGHVADLTRTIVVGDPGAWVERHSAVVAALDGAAGALRPGIAGRDVDATLRTLLAERAGPAAASMGHHAGHGLGLFAWEPPWIGSAEEMALAQGDVVALEPGIYDGGGGIRVEGMWLVQADGARRLDRVPVGLDPAALAGS
jgi:Xaa-Pro aminopeptidase